MAYGNTVIGLTVISKVILMFFAHKYSTDEGLIIKIISTI